MRHADSTLCAIGNLGLFFLFMFQVLNQLFPSVKTNEDFYEDRVFEIQLASQTAALTKAYEKLNISATKKTHIGRDTTAARTQEMGVPCADIASYGEWGEGLIDGSFNQTAGRVATGFTTERSSVHWPRDTLLPPISLQKMVFPFLEKSIVDYNQSRENDLATENFLSLMLEYIEYCKDAAVNIVLVIFVLYRIPIKITQFTSIQYFSLLNLNNLRRFFDVQLRQSPYEIQVFLLILTSILNLFHHNQLSPKTLLQKLTLVSSIKWQGI